ncbi:hypothetical protein CspeluHIS016_0502670 [Cutaneotrichosporon spelunceum]|uniref:Uncharacterized protein n=1 Tax=Cutaneotrichosporon spelunceum TaxID=1672016 RepID=A0AAD3YCL1_9TREE|nr:hypothetical protein CspeluHIS016_0502670 [Cutaneotrichosporon spelunceum]
MADSLQRAHQLSAQASILIRQPDADRTALDRALDAFREAEGLFEAAAQSADDSNRGTLKMLSNQHSRLVRDTERRIAALDTPPNPFRPSSPPSPSQGPQRSASTPIGPGLIGSGLGPGLTAVRASVPPFALRPVEPRFNPTSPLYSSSSSSEPPDESYLLPGAIPDTGDPFARFWGMLENMMEEISFPRALTTAVTSPTKAGTEKREKKGKKGKEKDGKEKGNGESPSSSESFYVVPEEKKAGKTPEELALENASLRASLDALAVHAHMVEKENRELKKRAEERDVTLRSMVLDVQKEARKARHQEVLRSQMINPPVVERDNGAQGNQLALRKHVAELEEEVRANNKKLEESRQENVKLNAQLNKFKEKWDKLKAKKEAKAKAREEAKR